MAKREPIIHMTPADLEAFGRRIAEETTDFIRAALADKRVISAMRAGDTDALQSRIAAITLRRTGPLAPMHAIEDALEALDGLDPEAAADVLRDAWIRFQEAKNRGEVMTRCPSCGAPLPGFTE